MCVENEAGCSVAASVFLNNRNGFVYTPPTFNFTAELEMKQRERERGGGLKGTETLQETMK